MIEVDYAHLPYEVQRLRPSKSVRKVYIGGVKGREYVLITTNPRFPGERWHMNGREWEWKVVKV